MNKSAKKIIIHQLDDCKTKTVQLTVMEIKAIYNLLCEQPKDMKTYAEAREKLFKSIIKPLKQLSFNF